MMNLPNIQDLPDIPDLIIAKAQNKKIHIQETCNHIRLVRRFIDVMTDELSIRTELHDNSKLEDPEMKHFIKIPSLKHIEYGSEEYMKNLDILKEALNHHYENNRHHPQYFKNGITDMNLIDIIEMFCDWCAAALRHCNPCIDKSIDISATRFNLPPELTKIFKNTRKDILKI